MEMFDTLKYNIICLTHKYCIRQQRKEGGINFTQEPVDKEMTSCSELFSILASERPSIRRKFGTNHRLALMGKLANPGC